MIPSAVRQKQEGQMLEDRQNTVPKAPEDTLETLRSVMSMSTIERLAKEVIERLRSRDKPEWSAPKEDIRILCEALCSRQQNEANQMIDELHQAGVSMERIYHGYLAVAARHLGAQWETSEMTFEEVSVAMARIYMILDDLRRRFPPAFATETPRLAFAAVPGEQHTLGVEMAADMFRRSGWEVTHLVYMTHDEIVEAAQDVDIVLLGLSASGRRQRAALLKLVVALRVVRPDLKIILSGEITNREPDLIAQIGIDAIVRDVPSALAAVEDLLKDLRTFPQAGN